MPEIDRGVVEELSRFFAPAYVREEVERLRGWQQQLQLDTSFGRVISSPTWISGVSIQNKTVDAEKLNVGELKAITAYTGHLVVSGQGGNNAGGSLIVAANLSEPLKSSITIRAVADQSNQAGITLRNSSGTKTVEMKLDGSGTIGAGPAITWDANGNVAVPVGLLAGSLTISNITGGRIGGNYDLHTAGGNPTNSNFIRLDPNNGIGIFGPTEEINWNNARAHLKLDGSAIFTRNVTIKSGTNATLDASPDTGIRLLGSGGAELFKLDVNGNLRIRSARVGDNGGPTGQRIEIDSTGIAGYSGTNQITFRLGTDGSGYIKAGNASNYAISWSATSVDINANNATINNLTINNVNGGTFGGTYEPTSDNRLVWTKHSSGAPMSFIASDRLWVETTSNQARFAQTARNTAGEIVDACSIDVIQAIGTLPHQYWGRLRLRYGNTFSDGPYIEYQYVPYPFGSFLRLYADTTKLEVNDQQINMNKFLAGTSAYFSGNLTVGGTLNAASLTFSNLILPGILYCSQFFSYNGTSPIYILLPENGEFQVRDSSNTVRGGWKSDGTLMLNGPTSSTGTHAGYITIELGGNVRKLAYYT